MTRQHRSSAAPRAALSAALLGCSLLALPVGCSSDPDAGDDERESEPVDVSRAREPVPSNEERPPANDAEPEPSGAGGDADADQDDTPPANGGDESPAAPGASAANDEAVAPAPAASFASCAFRDGSYGTDCDYVYVTMTLASPPRCVQLTIDNCDSGGYGRAGLPVDTPASWQLSSATIRDAAGACELGVFYPESSSVIDASGTIDLEGAASSTLPTSVTLDVALTPSSSADDTAAVEVVTTSPLSTPRCEED